MQSLALPRPTSLLSTPFGRPTEIEAGLAKFPPQFSPRRTEQQSYPSPPMSEPHSPSRRSTQTIESGRIPYPQPGAAPQRPEQGLPLPPLSSSIFNPRPASALQASPSQRPVYPGEQQQRDQPPHFHSVRPTEHAHYGAVPLPQTYGYGYQQPGVQPYPGIQHGGPMVQPGAMIAPPPSRPTKPARRTKAHVASACVNCKKAHLSCDVQRPCGRCVASGKQDTCKDVQHKKRGRPRLRDDREFPRPDEARTQASQVPSSGSGAETFPQQTRVPSPHAMRASELATATAANSTQTLEPLAGRTHTHSPSSGHQPTIGGAYGTRATPAYNLGPNPAYQSLPVAFLNLDLVVQKSNQVFQDLVAFLGDVKGKRLEDLLEARQYESLLRLRNELRDERDEREPTFMAPITPVGQDPMRAAIDSAFDQDVDQVSQGYTDRPMILNFRLPGDQIQPLQVQVRLAKTSLYFVTLVVRSPPRFTSNPGTAYSTAAPPPRTSQPMPAPNTVPVAHITPHQSRPHSSTNSAPSSPYFNFSSVRTSLPAFSPSSYSSSPSYGYSPTAGQEPGYFPSIQPASSSTTPYPTPYVAPSRNPSVTSEPLRELNRPGRLEGLHLPPIRTGPITLGSPVQLDSGSSGSAPREDRVRRRESSLSAEQRRPEDPETGKRRRLNIHEVLE